MKNLRKSQLHVDEHCYRSAKAVYGNENVNTTVVVLRIKRSKPAAAMAKNTTYLSTVPRVSMNVCLRLRSTPVATD